MKKLSALSCNMFRRSVARAALLALPALALSGMAYASDATFDKTLNVSGTVQLDVSTGAGYVHVTPGSDSQVHIIGHVASGPRRR